MDLHISAIIPSSYSLINRQSSEPAPCHPHAGDSQHHIHISVSHPEYKFLRREEEFQLHRRPSLILQNLQQLVDPSAAPEPSFSTRIHIFSSFGNGNSATCIPSSANTLYRLRVNLSKPFPSPYPLNLFGVLYGLFHPTPVGTVHRGNPTVRNKEKQWDPPDNGRSHMRWMTFSPSDYPCRQCLQG